MFTSIYNTLPHQLNDPSAITSESWHVLCAKTPSPQSYTFRFNVLHLSIIQTELKAAIFQMQTPNNLTISMSIDHVIRSLDRPVRINEFKCIYHPQQCVMTIDWLPINHNANWRHVPVTKDFNSKPVFFVIITFILCAHKNAKTI